MAEDVLAGDEDDALSGARDGRVEELARGDRVAELADQKVVAVDTIDELLKLDHPWIQEYFNGPRGRAAAAA